MQTCTLNELVNGYHPRIREVLNMPASYRVDGWRAIADDSSLPDEVRLQANQIWLDAITETNQEF